ncbi:hypothetical protein LARI1_G009355, partial [Lachnellula arida]
TGGSTAASASSTDSGILPAVGSLLSSVGSGVTSALGSAPTIISGNSVLSNPTLTGTAPVTAASASGSASDSGILSSLVGGLSSDLLPTTVSGATGSGSSSVDSAGASATSPISGSSAGTTALASILSSILASPTSNLLPTGSSLSNIGSILTGGSSTTNDTSVSATGSGSLTSPLGSIITPTTSGHGISSTGSAPASGVTFSSGSPSGITGPSASLPTSLSGSSTANATEIGTGSVSGSGASQTVLSAPTSSGKSTNTATHSLSGSAIVGSGSSVSTSSAISDASTVNASTPASIATAPTTTPSAPAITSAPATAPVSPTVVASTTALASPSTKAPETILPSSTNTFTSMWLPQTIIANSQSPSSSLGQAPLPTGIPAQLPRIITNPNATSTPPEGMTAVQLGFLFELNYEFVISNPLSSAQIFMFLPTGVADGLELHEEQVILHSLYPLDTTAKLGFITTAAVAYIPENMVDTLRLNLGTPSSILYNNPDSTVNALVNYLNPTIPLIPGAGAGDDSTSGTGAGSSPTNTAGNNDVFNTSSQNTSAGVKGTTAGIAMACVGGASAYGAAMFLLARRYKKRKQAHRRTSSVASHAEMRQSSSPGMLGSADIFMSGGRLSPGGTTNDRHSRGSGGGNSARTQQISAPMMAENSLGWN